MDGRDGAPRQYRGMIDCFRQVACKEGLAGLYKARARAAALACSAPGAVGINVRLGVLPRALLSVFMSVAGARISCSSGHDILQGQSGHASAWRNSCTSCTTVSCAAESGLPAHAGRGNDHWQDRAGGRHLLGGVRGDAHHAQVRRPAVLRPLARWRPAHVLRRSRLLRTGQAAGGRRTWATLCLLAPHDACPRAHDLFQAAAARPCAEGPPAAACTRAV